MKQYLDLMQKVLDNGIDCIDRTGVGTRSIFGEQLRFDLSKNFPAMTTKKLAFGAVKSELIWFLEGSGDEKRLREILHGSRDSEKGTIWTANSEAEYWKPKAKFEGDLGRIYGVQWRNWTTAKTEFFDNGLVMCPETVQIETDQLLNLVNSIMNDPNGRRHIISAWNPGELDQMALPPCHMMAQFYIKEGKISCMMTQRSVDVFLGLPFNIASYALMTHMLAQVCGLAVGELIMSLGDTHIYLNHIDQVREQLSREPLEHPQLWLNPDITNIDQFTMNDIQLDGYQSHPAIKAPMAV